MRRMMTLLLALLVVLAACAEGGDVGDGAGAGGELTDAAGGDGDDAEGTDDTGAADVTDDAEATDDAEGTDDAEATEGTDDEAAGSDDPLRIGMATTLSGAIALFGIANQNGAQLAVDQLNEAGGVLGRQIELTVRDDEARPEEGSAIARDLIISEEVDMLLGPVSSGVALAITEVSAEREIPFIVHTSNTEALMNEQFQPYMVSVVPNTGMEARAQGVDLADSEFTEWATIAPNYEFGQRQTATFVETITEQNPDVEIIEQQFPELGEPDLQPFIAALLAANPPAVYSPLFAGDLITFTRQANNLGFFEETYFTALYETDALTELGDEVDLEGVRGYSRCPFTIDTPQMAEFVEAYQADYDLVPSDWACMAYDAVMLWAEVVEENGSEDSDQFVETVEGFEFTSLRGDTYIREVDHQAAVPSYIGELTFDEELGFYVYGELDAVPAEETWLSEEEVEASREG